MTSITEAAENLRRIIRRRELDVTEQRELVDDVAVSILQSADRPCGNGDVEQIRLEFLRRRLRDFDGYVEHLRSLRRELDELRSAHVLAAASAAHHAEDC